MADNNFNEGPVADISKITARAVSKSASPGSQETFFLHIHFNEGSKMENIRAFILVGKLAEKGLINRTIPQNPQNDQNASAKIAESGFYISFTTSLFRDQIEALLKGTLSIETISFVRRLPEGGEEAPEPPKPMPKPQPISVPESAPADNTSQTDRLKALLSLTDEIAANKAEILENPDRFAMLIKELHDLTAQQ